MVINVLKIVAGVSHVGNTCGACKKASGLENCNSSNRKSGNLCINECVSFVNSKGNMCLPCAKSKGLSSGDITGQSKANNKKYLGPKRDAATAAAAEYESVHSNVDISSRSQANALAAAITNLTVEHLPSRQKILDMTSRQVSSLPVRELDIWFFTREESHHWFLKRKVLLSNWKIVMEQITGVTSIPMSVSLLDGTPLTSMMQHHQKLLQIMSNGKFNCTSEMFSQIMSSFYRLSQALEDVKTCRHTKLEHVSLCTTNTATCQRVQSSRAKSHLGQHISLRSPLQRSARSWTTSSQDDSFLSPQETAMAFPLPVLRIVILGIVRITFYYKITNSFVGPVLQIDISSKIIQLMTQRYQKYFREASVKRMELIVDDARGLTSLSSESVGGGVLDKGLVDVLHCSTGNGDDDDAAEILVLQPSRPFVFFSCSEPEYILKRTLGTVNLNSDRRIRQRWKEVQVLKLVDLEILLYRFVKADPSRKQAER